MNDHITSTLAIYHEHTEWFEPLFAALEARGVPHVRVRADQHAFDPSVDPTPTNALWFNRMSPSAGLRGRTGAISYTTQFLRHLEVSGARVVNGLEAWRTEVSKAYQISLLQRLSLPHPRTRVISHPVQLPEAAREIGFPLVVKPNVGGSGSGIRRFDSSVEVAEATDLDFGVDGTGLVQEFVEPRGGFIVRVEILNGRFLYAIAVYPPEGGFNLCPADACVGADGSELERSFCAADAPATGLRVEAFEPTQEIIEQVERITAAAGISIGGVEYVVDDRDGEHYFYDINALSNFVADPVRVIGFDPFERLADWLEEELHASSSLVGAGGAR